MKWTIRILIALILILNLGIVGFTNEVKNSENLDKETQITIVHITDKSNLGIEPLMIRGLVIKKIPQKNISLIRIVSETYRNRVIAIKGNINASKGQYIEGYFYEDKFAPIERKMK